MKLNKWLITLLAAMALMVGAFSTASAQNVTIFTDTIDFPGEIETYSTEIFVPTTVTVDVICVDAPPSASSLDPVVTLYDENDNLLAFDDDSGTVPCGGFFSATFTILLQPGYYEVDVSGFGTTTGPYTIIFTDDSDDDSAGFTSNVNPLSVDGRLNPDPQATAVLYCNTTTRVTEVYTITGSSGTFAFSFTNDDATSAVAGDIIGSGNGATVEKLADGRLLLRSPMSGGKNYLFIWNGCPLTRSETYSEDFNFGSPILASTKG